MYSLAVVAAAPSCCSRPAAGTAADTPLMVSMGAHVAATPLTQATKETPPPREKGKIAYHENPHKICKVVAAGVRWKRQTHGDR